MVIIISKSQKDFNPRSPRGLRLCSSQTKSRKISLFQSTQPKRAATTNPTLKISLPVLFQSTQPKRAATFSSINSSFNWGNFNPRSPRGLRLPGREGQRLHLKFQSTQPKRAATKANYSLPAIYTHFNPRSPRGLRHFMPGLQKQAASNFNPRSPRGLRRRKVYAK